MRGLLRPRSRLRHGVTVALRAGAATLAVAGLAHVAAPSVAPLVTIAAAVAVLAFELSRVHATLAWQIEDVAADVAQVQPLLWPPSAGASASAVRSRFDPSTERHNNGAPQRWRERASTRPVLVPA